MLRECAPEAKPRWSVAADSVRRGQHVQHGGCAMVKPSLSPKLSLLINLPVSFSLPAQPSRHGEGSPEISKPGWPSGDYHRPTGGGGEGGVRRPLITRALTVGEYESLENQVGSAQPMAVSGGSRQGRDARRRLASVVTKKEPFIDLVVQVRANPYRGKIDLP